MLFDDREYFRRRAAEERMRAETAASPVIAQVHLSLAAKYESLVKKAVANTVAQFERIDGQRTRA